MVRINRAIDHSAPRLGSSTSRARVRSALVAPSIAVNLTRAAREVLTNRTAKRFSRRAAALLADPAYTRAIAAARKEWDALHPNYAIGRGRWDEPEPRSPGLPAPARLQRAVLLRRDRASEACWAEWCEFVKAICSHFWPLGDFPGMAAWRPGRDSHPASRHVAATLLWGPEKIAASSEGWMSDVIVGVKRVEFDVDPGALVDQRLHQLVMAKLYEAADTGTPLTRKLLDDMQRSLIRKAIDDVERHRRPRPRCVLEIDPATSTGDLREQIPFALQGVRLSDEGDELTKLVSEAYEHGESRNSIARRLGLDRRFVDRIIRPP